MSSSDPQVLPFDGTAVPLLYGGQAFEVAVQDQAGLIDLNFAPAEVLRRLLEAAGQNELDAQMLADRVLDWREKGVGRRLNGAKPRDYAEAGFSYGPREGPFASVAELRLVMGITPGLFNQVAPALTVFSQKPVVEAAFAPRLVLEAAFGMSPAMAEAAMTQRIESRRQPSSPSMAAMGSCLQIAVMQSKSEGPKIISRTTIRLRADGTSLFWIYESR